MRTAFIRETAVGLFAKHEGVFRGLEKPLAADAVRAATALADALGIEADVAINPTLTAERDAALERAEKAETSLALADEIAASSRATTAELLELAESALHECAETSDVAREALAKIGPAAILLNPSLVEKRAPVHEIIGRPRSLFIGAKMPHWAMKGIAASLAETMKDAPNCSEMMASMQAGEFTVTVQRRFGKTPMQLRNEAVERAEKAEKAQADLVEVVALIKRQRDAKMKDLAIGRGVVAFLSERGWLP